MDRTAGSPHGQAADASVLPRSARERGGGGGDSGGGAGSSIGLWLPLFSRSLFGAAAGEFGTLGTAASWCDLMEVRDKLLTVYQGRQAALGTYYVLKC